MIIPQMIKDIEDYLEQVEDEYKTAKFSRDDEWIDELYRHVRRMWQAIPKSYRKLKPAQTRSKKWFSILVGAWVFAISLLIFKAFGG